MCVSAILLREAPEDSSGSDVDEKDDELSEGHLALEPASGSEAFQQRASFKPHLPKKGAAFVDSEYRGFAALYSGASGDGKMLLPGHWIGRQTGQTNPELIANQCCVLMCR